MKQVLGLFAALLLAPAAAPLAAETQENKPNVVIIFIDDMGYGDIGPFGATLQKTPQLDRMAREGMKFTSFYAAPVCSVSRAQLLTGCYGARVSVPGVYGPGGKAGLNPAEHTIAERLKERGYATMCIGKWHVGDQPEFLPTRQGFDRYFGIPYSNDMQKKSAKTGEQVVPLLRDDTVAELLTDDAQSRIVERYTDEAVGFIRASKDKPFLLYFAHTAVHTPIYPGAAFAGKSANGRFGDWVAEVDWSVGRVLETLRELKLDERTLVIFTSDNGPWLVKGRDAGSAGPLRGGKGSTFEGGLRVPALARWPGKIAPGSVCDAVAGTIDLLPTAVALAGGTVPAEPAIDGRDLSPLLFGTSTQSPREAHYYFRGYSLEAVRQGPWKLAVAPQHETMGRGTLPDASGPAPRLYNLDQEIGEKTNLADRHPDIVAKLQALAAKMAAEIGGESPTARRPAGEAANARTLYPTEADKKPAKAGKKPAKAAKAKPQAGVPKRPNIIFLMDDQRRWDALGCVDPAVKTPTLDRLAKEGILFDQAVCQAPMCVPSRYSMMLGLYPHQIGILSNGPGLTDEQLPCDTLPELLRKAGYQTAGFGKTHWLAKGATTRGFEVRYSSTDGEKGSVLMGTENPEGFKRYSDEVAPYGDGEEWPAGYLGRTSQVPEGDHRDGWTFNKCLEFLDKGLDKKRPLFLYLSFLKPHAGANVPPGYEDLYKLAEMPVPPQPALEQVEPCHATGSDRQEMYRSFWSQATREQWQQMVLRYRANGSWIDSMFGRVMDKLRAEGMLENCLIVYVSDHGEMLGERYYRFNKYCLFESSARVPLILSGTAVPAEQRGATDHRMAEEVDIYPTLAAAAGLTAVSGKPGENLLGPSARKAGFCEYSDRPAGVAFMWRTRELKLILTFPKACVQQGSVRLADATAGEFYDLKADPKEWKNLYAHDGCKAGRERMAAELVAHLNTVALKRAGPAAQPLSRP